VLLVQDSQSVEPIFGYTSEFIFFHETTTGCHAMFVKKLADTDANLFKKISFSLKITDKVVQRGQSFWQGYLFFQ